MGIQGDELPSEANEAGRNGEFQDRNDTHQTSATKKCPFCAETIKAEAILCRYCGRELDPDRVTQVSGRVTAADKSVQVPVSKNKQDRQRNIYIAPILLSLGLAVLILLSRLGEYTSSGYLETNSDAAINDLTFHFFANWIIYFLVFIALSWLVRRIGWGWVIGGGLALIIIFFLIFSSASAESLSKLIQSIEQKTGGTVSQGTDENFLFQETFSNTYRNWHQGTDEGESYDIRDGAYYVTRPADGLFSWSCAGADIGSGVLKVETRGISGTNIETGQVILFRYQDPQNFYGLFVPQDGLLEEFVMVDGEYIPLDCRKRNSWGYCTSRATSNLSYNYPPGSNTITIRMNEESFIIFLNDDLVLDFMDPRFPSGDICLGAFSSEDSPVEVAFDEVVVTRIQ